MASDISGVTDTRSALDRDIALRQVDDTPLASAVILSLDGARMALPFEADQIEQVVDKAYRIGGFVALTMIHTAAVTAFDAFLLLRSNQIATRTGQVSAFQDAAKVAKDKVPESGHSSAAEAYRAERRYIADLYQNDLPAALQRIEYDHLRRKSQLADLRAAIDRFAEIEEVAQRWYETKLMASIVADFEKRQKDLQAAWHDYWIGDAKTGIRVWLKDTKSADGLTILTKTDTATIQTGAMDETVPAVVAATYQLARAQYDYIEAFGQAKRAAGLRRGKVDKDNPPAWIQRKNYAALVATWGERHFIALSAHRGMMKTSRDFVFDRKTYDAAIINAFLKARDTMPELLANMQANVLFQDAEPVAIIDHDAMALPAALVLIFARYTFQADTFLPEKTPVKDAQGPQGKPDHRAKAPVIYRSPWLQKPFRDRLIQLADVLRIEGALVDAATLTANAPPGPDDKVYHEVAARLERMKAEVAHLRPLFQDAADRQKLLWSFSQGMLMYRARTEVTERLEARIEKLTDMRAAVQLGVAAAGLILIPFTGGQSIIVAGAIDAMLVAERTAEDVQKWIAAKQFSAAVLDELASMHWAEPETAMLVGMFLEAGYEIAGDLIQSGSAGKIFDMISAADLVLGVADTSIDALKMGAK